MEISKISMISSYVLQNKSAVAKDNTFDGALRTAMEAKDDHYTPAAGNIEQDYMLCYRYGAPVINSRVADQQVKESIRIYSPKISTYTIQPPEELRNDNSGV